MFALADVAKGGIDRLHARAAIDLHGKGHHRFAQPQPEGGNAGRVHLVGDDIDTAKDDEIKALAVKRLARQQRPAGLHREIDRGEGAGLAAGLEEGRAGAIDEIDSSGHCAAILSLSLASSPG